MGKATLTPPPTRALPSTAGALPLLCFLFSGACGLVYEVVWTRLFEFVFGCSHQSMAIVVAVFMGGLALGSLAGGRLADRSRAPLRLYGWLVLGIGAFCILIPTLLSLATPLFGKVYRLHDGDPEHPLFTGVKVLAATAILLVPTTLMGATLPVLTRHLTTRAGEVGARLGSLYAANTLGAVAGAWSAGFLLIPTVGLWWTSALAAAIDAAIGASILVLFARSRVPAAAAHPRVTAPVTSTAPPPGSAPPARPWLVVAAFGVSGMVDMCLQLAWTRSLILSLGNSTYAFSAIVGIFILGLSAGSAIAALFADRIESPQAALGWVMTGAAVLSACTIPALGVFAPSLARWLADLSLTMTMSFPKVLALGTLWAFVLIFPATVLMGMTFPLVARLAVRSVRDVGSTIGVAYFSNTLGSILGTLLIGFVLLPLTGHLWAPLYLAAGVGLAAGLVLVVLDPSRPERRTRRWGLAGVLLLALLPAAWATRPWGVLDGDSPQRYWDPVTLSMGPFLQYDIARLSPSVTGLEKVLRNAYETKYYRDGETASVGVFAVRGTDMQGLRINGKVDASSGSQSLDMPTQLLSGHLPMLARSGAKRVLNVGVGSGITVGSMALYPGVESVTCLELSPEVYQATRFFAESNHRFFENPKVRAVSGDGRNHLQHTEEKYNVISSEPSNFWIAGMGNLFTREFYELMKAHLTEDGIACQWLQAYSLRASDFRAALRTFANRFPHVALFTPGGDILFLGSLSPFRWSREWMERCLAVPEIAGDLVTIGIDRPEAVFRYLRLEEDDVRRLAGDGPENSDLFPYLEYRAPLGLFMGRFEVPPLIAETTLRPLASTLDGFKDRALAETYRAKGARLQRLITDLDSPVSADLFNRLAKLLLEMWEEHDPWVLKISSLYLKTYSGGATDQDRDLWRLFLRRVALVCKEPMLQKAIVGLGPGEVTESVVRASASAALPGDWTPWGVLGQQAIARNDPKGILESAGEIQKHGGPPHITEAMRGISLVLSGDLDGAEAALDEALKTSPPGWQGEVLFDLGLLAEKRGDLQKAIDLQWRAIEGGAEPRKAVLALARSSLKAGKVMDALAAAKKVLEIDANSAEALVIAGKASIALGNAGTGKKLLEKAARLDPRYAGAASDPPPAGK